MIFIDSKYAKIYFLLIERAKTRKVLGYTETHHIIPRSMGGNNKKENLVELTAREHFIAHRLLTKITVGVDRQKMIYALWRMCTRDTHTGHLTSRVYNLVRQQFAETHSQRMKGQNNPYYGKTHSEEYKQAARERASKQRWTKERKQEWGAKMAGEGNLMFGKTHTPEARLKISQKAKGRTHSTETKEYLSKISKGKAPKAGITEIECPHCGKVMNLGNAKKHHFDNCKLSPNYVPKPKRTYNIKRK
jgi:hypothetical protein